VIIIMQENRSFDSYFGTYPGANGIPPGVCLPLNMANRNGKCIKPYHNKLDQNAGGPHFSAAGQADLDNGISATRMDGFVAQQWAALHRKCPPNGPDCDGNHAGILRHDVVGYHNADEIPNYWAYARHFVLQDQLFEGERSWSLPSHLDMVSEWVATCTNNQDAATCTTVPEPPRPNPDTEYPWANLFQLLDVNKVSWKYYLGVGREPDCDDGEMTCAPQIQAPAVPSIWNPLPYFGWTKRFHNAYLEFHNPSLDQFLIDIKGGTLPQVAWIVPADAYSEHPPNGVTAGMEYVTSLINAIMQSPYWQNTAIFLSWDDWGGFYDHVAPPNVDGNNSNTPIEGFGLRVPGLLVSAYAKAGMIDDAVYSFDAYATFFENIFMNGARLNPAQLGNPDARPDIRDALTSVTFPDGTTAPIGNLMNEFDFTQTPLPPLVLSAHIPTGITADCNVDAKSNNLACRSSIVTIQWSPVTGPEVPGPFVYHITRDGTDLAQCMGSATKCKDRPGKGVHFYRAYAINSVNMASPLSAAAVVDEP
jgi:phospholipase C